MAGALGLATCASPPAPVEQPRVSGLCGRLLPLLVVYESSAYPGKKVIYGQDRGRATLYLSGLKIDADGAPDAYHRDDVSGLDALANARWDGRWVGIATDRFGRPFIQRPGDPAPGYYVSTTSLYDKDIAETSNPARYVDATRVPYIALPGGRRAVKAYEGAGIELGDLAIVYNLRTRKMTGAVLADYGPESALGEGSIALARELGLSDTSPRHGGVADRENLVIVFPGSGAGFPRELEHIQSTADKLFAKWGGEKRLADCAGVLR
jgi:hypothetical protein